LRELLLQSLEHGKRSRRGQGIPHGIASEVTLGLRSPSLSRDEVRSRMGADGSAAPASRVG